MIVDNHYDPLGEGAYVIVLQILRFQNPKLTPFSFPFFFLGNLFTTNQCVITIL